MLSLLVALFLAPTGLSPAGAIVTGDLANATSAICSEARSNVASAGPVVGDPGSPPRVRPLPPPSARRRALARLVTFRSWPRSAERRGPSGLQQRSPDPQAVGVASQVIRARSSRRFSGRRTRGLAAAEPRGAISEDAGPDDPAPHSVRRLELARGLAFSQSPLRLLRELA